MLRRSYRVGALVDALAAIGIAVPRLYRADASIRGAFDRARPEFSYAIPAGAPLMAGWTVLLRADRRPLQRRGVLPITVAPVIAGLMANDVRLSAHNAAIATQGSWQTRAPIRRCSDVGTTPIVPTS
jgi:hypothetical protein